MNVEDALCISKTKTCDLCPVTCVLYLPLFVSGPRSGTPISIAKLYLTILSYLNCLV